MPDRQCFAFNKDSQRCEMPAGHDLLHRVTKEWDDDECVFPNDVAVLKRAEQVQAFIDEPVPAPPIAKPTSNCIACGHKHKAAECKCGCYEFIG